PLTGVACPMTMATRITTATTGSSDRPGAKIFQIRNLPQDCGPLLLQMAERFGHSAPPFAERIIYARFSGSKKETCRILTFMSHTPLGVAACAVAVLWREAVMSHRRVLALTVFCGLLLSAIALSQQSTPKTEQKADQPVAKFSGSVNEVILPVTVTDEKGKFVSNLVANDFRVLDEGRPQRINFFSHTEKQPFVVGFLIDQSNASKIHWTKYQDSILELVWHLLPGDKRYTGYLISYSNTADILVNTTYDSEKI